MKPKIYLETSIISYAANLLSRDLVIAGQQQITQEWLNSRSSEFDMFVSPLVFEEVSAGDPEAAKRRLQLIQTIQVLEINSDAIRLAECLISDGPIPEKAEADAYHIAVAVANGMDYLLTWNCKHIANPRLHHKINEICMSLEFEPVVICTPFEMMEVDPDVP